MDRNLLEIVERAIGRAPGTWQLDRHGLTTWTLAHMALCYTPDALDSAGANFLETVREAVLDAIRNDYVDVTDADADNCDAVHEIADGAVPVYTHDRWLAFVDLGAYQEQYLGDFGFGDNPDMTEAAGLALFIIGERLAYDLIRCAADSVAAARDLETENA